MEQPNEKELTQAYLKQVEILEEDDDFDEFEIDGIYFLIFFIFLEWEDKTASIDDTRLWKNNWEDEDIDDDFIIQLRKELKH